MSVACPATRRDGRRRLRLRKRKWETSNLKLQSAKVKIFKLESSKLNLESCQILKLLNIESYQSWKLSNVESCWILKVVNVECWKLSNTVKVLNIGSLLICCLLTSFQRRSYCKQSDIKRIKRSEELWKVIPKEILRVRVFYSSW